MCISFWPRTCCGPRAQPPPSTPYITASRCRRPAWSSLAYRWCCFQDFGGYALVAVSEWSLSLLAIAASFGHLGQESHVVTPRPSIKTRMTPRPGEPRRHRVNHVAKRPLELIDDLHLPEPRLFALDLDSSFGLCSRSDEVFGNRDDLHLIGARVDP